MNTSQRSQDFLTTPVWRSRWRSRTTKFVRYGNQIPGFQVSGPQRLSVQLTRSLSVMASLVFFRKTSDDSYATGRKRKW